MVGRRGEAPLDPPYDYDWGPDMARSRLDDDGDATKPKNDVYVGMLALAALSMAVGVGLLALEANEYDWDAQPKAVAPVSLPAPVPARSSG